MRVYDCVCNDLYVRINSSVMTVVVIYMLCFELSRSYVPKTTITTMKTTEKKFEANGRNETGRKGERKN